MGVAWPAAAYYQADDPEANSGATPVAHAFSVQKDRGLGALSTPLTGGAANGLKTKSGPYPGRLVYKIGMIRPGIRYGLAVVTVLSCVISLTFAIAQANSRVCGRRVRASGPGLK